MRRFFKFELLARQKRPSTPKSVRWTTWLYGKVSDYGMSITKPLTWLGITGLGSWALQGLIFMFINKCFDPAICKVDPHLLSETLERGLAFAVPPFTLLINSQISLGETPDIPAFYEILSGSVMLAHAMLASTLIFLLLLAIKRRMQIK